jgi:hypothetical protein
MLKPKFSLKNDAFVIENYNQARPFSSFLPGISGLFGKPMWVFYTNRGQCVSSFGVRNKNGAMLEFYPANKAYATTPLVGFRTFIRFKKGSSWTLYEPFRMNAGEDCKQVLRIRAHEVEIEETHRTLGLRTTVVLFNATDETLPVLVRQVKVENLGKKSFQGEILDGLPQIVPYGLNETLLKQMSRTMEAFAEVPHWEEQLPFFKLKTEPSDKPEVEWIKGGFFSFARLKEALTYTPLNVLVDPEYVFGEDSSFQVPQVFASGKPMSIKGQRVESTFGCAFSHASFTLGTRKEMQVESYYGQADDWSQATLYREHVNASPAYAESKRKDNATVLAGVTDVFAIHSGSPAFDAYSRQSYLDNVLRGGQPVHFSDGANAQIYHAYSRKHGDMERDYNFFELSPTYFSQGNGNYRDVNQNRRSENYLHQGVGAGNIETFFNLLQLDGYNPLVTQYEKYAVKGKFVRPGDLFEKLLETMGDVRKAQKELMRELAPAKKNQDAIHGEGFWVDHWMYNLDLLESYAAIYPDQLEALFIGRNDFTFYDNDYVVRPRDKKYVLRADGAVRQMHAVTRDHEKARLFRGRKEDPHKVRTRNGTGSIYQTTLLAKVLGLLAVKASTLDPFGMGIEMEAEKPGWCDALNGLPGLLGSSMNESIELRRWGAFVKKHLAALFPEGKTLLLAEELAELLKAVQEALALAKYDDFFRTWDSLASFRERFRQKTRMGVTGEEVRLTRNEIEAFLNQLEVTLASAQARATNADGLCTTYFINEVTDYEKLPVQPRSEDPDATPIQHVKALRFKQIPLSPFLEGPMHALRTTTDVARARKLYQAVKNSDLYDRKLGMYKLNVPLIHETFEIGRNKIFTPGWLENESIFLHMHYKFLFELLRAGLSEEFFSEMKTGIVAFMNPIVYGRSTFENSSFIASSRFPDHRVHGRGFVARLSGSTAEWVSIVLHMALGAEPFRMAGGELRFEPRPTLPAWLFSSRAENGFDKGTFAFKMFGNTWVVYHNASRKDTSAGRGLHAARFVITTTSGQTQTIAGRFLPDVQARALRDGKIARLLIDLE